MTKASAQKQVEVTIGEEMNAVITGASKVEVSATGVSVSNDFNTVVLNGVNIQQVDGRFVFSVPANDTAPQPADGFVPGQLVPGSGIYIGKYMLKDGDNNGLSLTFNAFAAPQDLTDGTYEDTVKHIAKLKGWHGFDGTPYANDEELKKALKDGSYIKEGSGWFMPTREMVSGTDADGKHTTPDNFSAYYNVGGFRGTFDTAGWYWSSTQNEGKQEFVAAFRLADRRRAYFNKNQLELNTRPVRLELCKGPQ